MPRIWCAEGVSLLDMDRCTARLQNSRFALEAYSSSGLHHNLSLQSDDRLERSGIRIIWLVSENVTDRRRRLLSCLILKELMTVDDNYIVASSTSSIYVPLQLNYLIVLWRHYHHHLASQPHH